MLSAVFVRLLELSEVDSLVISPQPTGKRLVSDTGMKGKQTL